MNTPIYSPLDALTAALRTAGRPTTYSKEALQYLCNIITERGLSDSAAAGEAKISTSSLGRWKKQHEEVRLALLEAREGFRAIQLDQILEASRGPRGWRAAAWLLERVFPEDYSPRAA